MFLAATNEKISVITNGTTTVDAYASWADVASGAVTVGKQVAAIVAGAPTTTDVVSAPASSTQRTVKELFLRNKHATASTTVTVQLDVGGTLYEIIKLTLLAGYTLQYKDGFGFVLIDSSGGRVETDLTGRLLNVTVLTSGTSFTTGPATNRLVVKLCGGGGQGGGCAATIGCCGSGGGSGGYAEWNIAVTPNTAYTYGIGAAGTTGGTGANGQAGGNTTFVVGATTCTAFGGSGGINGASIAVPVLGGAGGIVSTNGTVNCPGIPGEGCIATGTAANNRSGAGASSPFGGGANAVLEATNTTGTAAAGFGSGGSGAATSAATARAGGAGSAGIIVVFEYSG